MCDARNNFNASRGFRGVLLCALLILQLIVTGCGPPDMRLSFPASPMRQDHGITWYAATGDGKPSFGTSLDTIGRLDSLYYSDHEDAKPDRIYRLSDYADADVPHVLILLDSIPYQSVVDFYRAGHLRFMCPPAKVIAPFPSLTEVCFTDVLHAPPLPGMIDQSYDPRTNQVRDAFWDRVHGYQEPWQRRLDYHSEFWEDGMSYLQPRRWYAAELERARRVSERSPHRVTIVYIDSASSMVCKYGRRGVNEALEQAEQLCLQILYERHGAVKLSLMADHGHNLMHSVNVPVDDFLTKAGLHPTDSIHRPDDVVVELNGLVTYAAVQTSQPARVADALLAHSPIQLAMYLDGDRVIVRSARATAAIDCRAGRLRYVPLSGDVLDYRPVMKSLAAMGESDADGFASDADWLSATIDGPWPDAPRRIWDAFHREALFPPRVMFTLDDGYCAGLAAYEKYIDMASTHGGLNQINSATFVMTMNATAPAKPMRSRDVLRWLEPGFEPRVNSVP
jgi:hypothetical protein